ncbi:mannose-6-phosphate isomerase, class I [Corynebacterium pacaense]|uniref:mannose-6-phosphate isomerase, class I n=1 Tax=Corynebacterium pacaense TaxID=1816684 RepID=UPI0009BA87AF|nr:mannose-6-phosphate isomerase, class I [Corynebacterium pacaense]
MELLEGALRAYPWGSRTMIPELRGLHSPSTRPEAEIWFGAHPGAPSTINGIALNRLIADNPGVSLGPRVSEEFGGELPFLMKILAADEPLSLQAHPSLEQAREGFARENAAGINLQAPNRNYRDANHKPELIVALTDFIAMAGFRPLPRTLEIFDALDCTALDRYRSMIDVDNESESLRALFTTWITIPVAARHLLIRELIAQSRRYVDSGADEEIRFILSQIIALDERYPGDAGVLGALLLNFYHLSPGEGIYLDAGQLHAYIHGMGVEIMANSDNVLRGGLTSKYVDVPELVRVLRFESLADGPVRTRDEGPIRHYPVPISEFILDRMTVEQAHTVDHDGPMIMLCTAGRVELRCGATTLELGPGDAAWVPACDGAVHVSGTGAEVFLARV